jgi:uncharacterized radical SAM superfamily Fe-S cluster-containing enzyme
LKESTFVNVPSTATALCDACQTLIPAAVVEEGDSAYLVKDCAEHGNQRTMLSDDVAYFRRAREMQPARRAAGARSAVDRGCLNRPGIVGGSNS